MTSRNSSPRLWFRLLTGSCPQTTNRLSANHPSNRQARLGIRLSLHLMLALVAGLLHLEADPVIIDHTCTVLDSIPPSAIANVQDSLHIAYGHTSHGSQVAHGMSGLVGFMNAKQDDAFPDDAFAYNNGGSGGALDFRDTPFSGANDLGSPNRTAWAIATRNYLDAHPEVNVIMWSWCGQVDGSEADIAQYLDLMTRLEDDYADVAFVYMTGHLDGSGAQGNVNTRNNQIRDYCTANGKILYDFADIESYDPDGLVNYMELYANDNCDYDSDGNGSRESNWATAWQTSHTLGEDWFDCYAAHSKPLNGNLKAYAAWWLYARLAGWAPDGNNGGSGDGDEGDDGNQNSGIPARADSFETGRSPQAEVHVATDGDDSSGDGSAAAPFRTLAHAAETATPGTAIRLHPGAYSGGAFIYDLTGTADNPIWIGGLPSQDKPVISGGSEGLHLIRCRYLVIHDLEIAQSAQNGINCDDGGHYADPDAARYLVFRDLHIRDIGTNGNQDGLKLSGVDDFFVLDCEIYRCGGGSSGSGIDMVGCHNGLIAGNILGEHSGNAIQCKGGSSGILIHGNTLYDSGERSINIGGSTGHIYFRPPLSTTGVNAEARNIQVVANVFEGSVAPLAFVGAVDCAAVNNTIVNPGKWFVRILQETRTNAEYTFAPSGNNLLVNNIFYNKGSPRTPLLNIGSATAPTTFTFASNLWFNGDSAGAEPNLPVTETGGIYGEDPLFVDASSDYRLQAESPARGAGSAMEGAPYAKDFYGNTYANPRNMGAFGEASPEDPPEEPVDITAPPAPEDFAAALGGDLTVGLTWTPTEDAPASDGDAADPSGLAGYRIYRATADSGNCELLATVADTATAWTDDAVELGGTYRYYITAFDALHNESAGTPEISVPVHDETYTTWNAWLNANFSENEQLDPAVSGMRADATGGDIPNLLRFACGLGALDAVASPLMAAIVEREGARHLQLSFDRLGYAPGMSYVLQASFDGSAWTTLATVLPGYPKRVVVMEEGPIANGQAPFIRLKVELQEE